MARPRIPRGFEPLLNAYKITAAEGGMETDVAGGAARYGLQFERGTQMFDVSMLLSELRFSVWNTFYYRRIAEGTITFDMPLDSSYGVVDHACNIVPRSHSAVPSGPHWLVSFQVRAENRAFDMTEAEVDALLALYEEVGDAADDLLRRIAQFANVDLTALDF